MLLDLEQLNELAKSFEFGSAHNAITCADLYRKEYSIYLDKFRTLEEILKSLKGILPNDLNELIDLKLKSAGITI